MIKIENVSIHGFEEAIRGMRNPKNSWDRSDSGIECTMDKFGDCLNDDYIDCDNCIAFKVGPNDHKLMMQLVAGGSVRAKYRRMITVYLDITAPLYWWKEFDTYKVGTVVNSCSTMHKIHAKEFTLDDFSYEHLKDFDGFKDPAFKYDVAYFKTTLETMLIYLNSARKLYLQTGDKQYWWQMIQLLPSSYNQKRTVMLNYEVLAGIYPMRKDHKLDEWQEFCRWIERLPYSEIMITKES